MRKSSTWVFVRISEMITNKPSIVKVRSNDMTEEMQNVAREVIESACEKNIGPDGYLYSGIASIIRDEFDKEYNGPGWNCVIGSAFGACVTYETKNYL